MKKVLSVLLCVVMLFSLVAVTAFADDAPVEIEQPAVLHICPNHKAVFPELEDDVLVTDTYLLIKTSEADGFVHFENNFVFDESFDGATLVFAYAYDGGVIESESFTLEVCHVAVDPYHYDDNYHWNVCSLCGDPYGKELHSYLLDGEEGGISHVCDGCGIEEPSETFATASKFTEIINMLSETLALLLEFIIGLF